MRGPMIEDEPESFWVDCVVSLPTPDGTDTFSCQAKVRCADVVDALDLDRWSSMAFRHLWRMAKRSPEHRRRSLTYAKWYIERAMGHGWQVHLFDVIASVLEGVAESHEREGADPLVQIRGIAADLRSRNEYTLDFIGQRFVAEFKATKAP